MQFPNFGRSILCKSGLLKDWLLTQDEKHSYLKYIIVFIVIALLTFVWGNNPIWDYAKLLERHSTIQSEISKIRPQLTTDSLRLTELKGLNKEIEIIARERYLMKFKGEDIFLIHQDSTNIKK